MKGIEEIANLIKILLLALLIFIPLSIVSTITHEQAHIRAAEEHNINMTMKLGVPLISEFLGKSTGRAVPKTEKDKELFNNATFETRTDISLAGMRSDLYFMFMLAVFLLIYCSLIYEKKRRDILVCSVTIIWVIFLILTTLKNLFHPLGDLHVLVNNLPLL